MGKYAWRNIAIPVKNQNPQWNKCLGFVPQGTGRDCWQLALETLDRISVIHA
jgi:hypothetical protein